MGAIFLFVTLFGYNHLEFFETAKQTPEFITELSKWIKEDTELRNTCGMS